MASNFHLGAARCSISQAPYPVCCISSCAPAAPSAPVPSLSAGSRPFLTNGLSVVLIGVSACSVHLPGSVVMRTGSGYHGRADQPLAVRTGGVFPVSYFVQPLYIRERQDAIFRCPPSTYIAVFQAASCRPGKYLCRSDVEAENH